MYQQVLITLSLVSATLSLALGIAFCVTVRRLGSLSPTAVSWDEHPAIDVIVPARNEEADLEKSVRSILNQQSVQVRVILVNDHSTDRTRQLADSLSGRDNRVAVIHDPPLADGWFGKPNAMRHGLLASTAPFVVFADADIVHAPRCFVSAISEMKQQQIDFLSLCPCFECESFWENVLLPHSFIAGTLQFAAERVNDDDSPRAAAAGAFMLTRRDVLDRVGGLEPIKSQVLDDVALARLIKRNGFKTRMRLAPELLHVRLFKGNYDAFWGFTKNILDALDYIWMAVPTMFLPMFVYWVPITTAAIGVLQQNTVMVVAGAAAYIVQAGLLLLLGRLCCLRFGKALCFPLGAVAVLCCIGKALYLRWARGAVAWRGRLLPLGEAQH